MDFLLAAENGQGEREATGVSGTARTVDNSERHPPIENPSQNPSTSGAVLKHPGMSEDIPGSTPNSGFGVDDISLAVPSLLTLIMLEMDGKEHDALEVKCNTNKGGAKRQAAQMIGTFEGLLGTPGCKVFAAALNTALTTGLNSDETMRNIHTIFTTEKISLQRAVAKVCADIISDVLKKEVREIGLQKEKLTAAIVQVLENAKEGPIFHYLVMGMFETVKALSTKYNNSRRDETNSSDDSLSEFVILLNMLRRRGERFLEQFMASPTLHARQILASLNSPHDD